MIATIRAPIARMIANAFIKLRETDGCGDSSRNDDVGLKNHAMGIGDQLRFRRSGGSEDDTAQRVVFCIARRDLVVSSTAVARRPRVQSFLRKQP